MLADDGGMVLNRRRRIRCSSDRASLVAPIRHGRGIQRRLAILAFWRSVEAVTALDGPIDLISHM